MEYDPSDSSGTDDDLPPSYQNRNARGGGPRVSGNGRSTAVVGGGGGGPASYSHAGGALGDMETQIHILEQEAYSSVLRAFKAQADAITWEKESLITELRKELRVSDKEHRELLARVNADDIIRKIREWRQGGRAPTSLGGMEAVASPTVSASRKRQKTGPQPMTSLSSMPSAVASQPAAAALHPQPPPPQPPVAVPMQPSTSSAAKKGVPPPFAKGKKPKPGQKVASGVKTMPPFPSAGPSSRGPAVGSRSGSGALATNEHRAEAAAAPYNPLIGRKVLTRWPEDNNFYEAVITDYNAAEGLHALVYDMNTPNETWEWVNLKEISPEDIRWDGEDPGINQQRSGRGGGPGHGGVKKSMGRGGGAMPAGGRGRGSLKNIPKKDAVAPLSQNGIARKNPDDIEILHTESLIKEVERVFHASHPDPAEMEKAKKALKEHEQSLIDAIARLAEASDGESGGGNGQHMAIDGS